MATTSHNVWDVQHMYVIILLHCTILFLIFIYFTIKYDYVIKYCQERKSLLFKIFVNIKKNWLNNEMFNTIEIL